jgi:hypothetical protein
MHVEVEVQERSLDILSQFASLWSNRYALTGAGHDHEVIMWRRWLLCPDRSRHDSEQKQKQGYNYDCPPHTHPPKRLNSRSLELLGFLFIPAQ